MLLQCFLFPFVGRIMITLEKRVISNYLRVPSPFALKRNISPSCPLLIKGLCPFGGKKRTQRMDKNITKIVDEWEKKKYKLL